MVTLDSYAYWCVGNEGAPQPFLCAVSLDPEHNKPLMMQSLAKDSHYSRGIYGSKNVAQLPFLDFSGENKSLDLYCCITTGGGNFYVNQLKYPENVEFKFHNLCNRAAINAPEKYRKLETEKLASVAFASTHGYYAFEDDKVDIVNSLPIIYRSGYDREYHRVLLQ